jgi:putative ABC transport system substrate-binding protein
MVRRVGWLQIVEAPGTYLDAFRDELRTLGHGEGDSLVIEARSAETVDALPARVAELVALQPEVIVTLSTPATRAAQDGTSSIPIVFNLVGDPVGSGFVASLARPGGNLTGLTNISTSLGPKRLELLQGTLPGLARVAVLRNATNPTFVEQVHSIEAAAGSYGIAVQDAPVREVAELDGAIDAAMANGAQAFIDLTSPFSGQTGQLLMARRLPAMFQTSEQVVAGGLMSYGPNLPASFRRVAGYVDKILRGMKPADLPVEQPVTFDLIINLKAARALGLTLPPSILAQATEIVQ